jgi:WD40 repeat protein
MFRHAQEWISDIKFGYNTLIVGSHDNSIYVYDFNDGQAKRKYAAMRKHSSYITHIDVSRDSCFLQSTCGAYEILFWDLNTGKQITAGATVLRDERWATWTCNLGWPVQGIYPKCTDGTFINSVDRSNFSINGTKYKDDSKSPYLLGVGNDNGKVCVYNYPCTLKGS